MPVLLDTGAQFSIVNFNTLAEIITDKVPTEKSIASLSIRDRIKGYIAKLKVLLPGLDSVTKEILCLPDFDIDMHVEGINQFISSLKEADFALSPSVPEYAQNKIKIFGILGNDLIQHLRVFEINHVQGGKMLRLTDGFVPIGSLMNFDLKVSKTLCNETSNECYCSDAIVIEYDVNTNNKFSKLTECDDDPLSYSESFGSIVSEREGSQLSSPSTRQQKSRVYNKVEKHTRSHPDKPLTNEEKSAINFVFNSNETYYSPLRELFPESEVQHGLEFLFSLETIGIANETISDFDIAEINKFKESINLKDGKYYVDIPWNYNLINKVPSNFSLCKCIAKKVSFNNSKLEMDDKYFDVFRDQLSRGIIEEIVPDDPENHIWVSHRPIVKTDPLVINTKIRPVFNCSLKTKGLPSLNEAAYGGIDLMADMFGLLQYFRTNSHILLADIAKAFLNIKLNKVSDKNKFSFVVYNNDQFFYYRYTSIIFGFIASPFILNYIIQHIGETCTDLSVRDVLSNKFYVDNLVYCSNDASDISNMYSKITESLAGGGFGLQEWCTNSSSIGEEIKACEPSINYTEEVKMLGYVYSPLNDTVQLKNFTLDCRCNTKRAVLSNVHAIFDPLGILSPVVLNAKLYLRKICNLKIGWDDKIPENLVREWAEYSLKVNACVSNYSFPRQVANWELPADYVIFTDASQEAYGFVIYCVQNVKANIIFSKTKVAPKPKKNFALS